jgi:hypothetical protein
MIRAVSDDAAFGPGGVEPGQQLGAGQVAEPCGDRVGVDAAAGRRFGQPGRELLGAGGGLDGDLVEVGKVADLVGDVPAGRGGRRVPAVLVEAGDQGAGDG